MVESSYYFSYEREPASVGNGSVGMVLYLPQENFSLASYTDIYLTVSGAAALEAPGADYEALIDEVTDRVEANQRCAVRDPAGRGPGRGAAETRRRLGRVQ